MKHTLPQLPYNYNSLEPFIDAMTMEIHHTKHHQAYIDNLNTALEKHPDFSNINLDEILKDLDKIPEDIKLIVRNNGGGHYNHSLFWELMSDKHNQTPSESLLKIISAKYTSFDKFQEEFSNTAIKRFGSGWAWLVLKPNKTIEIYSTPNQDNPLMQGDIPLLGLDVWEHAYYLKYQNKRAEYIKNWWNVVNWKKVEELYNLQTV